MIVRLSEPNGATFDFGISDSKTTLLSQPYAISNAAGDKPHGKYDPRNTQISYEDNGNKIVVYATDGAVRFYYKQAVRIRATCLFLLQKEILPNGKVLKYYYDDKNQLSSVESLDPKERYVYASLRLTGSPLEENCHFTSSSGLAADYGYQRRPMQVKIKEKTRGGEHREELNFNCPPILTSVSSPFYRHETLDYGSNFLLESYSGKDHIFSTQHAEFGANPHYRVNNMSLPVGLNDSFQTVYEINYEPPVAGEKSGSTHVKDIDETSIVYHFSKNLLMTAIQYFGQDGELKKEKVLSWDDHNWLKSIEMRDGQKNCLYKKSYAFDTFGNPMLEIFEGDLTGTGVHDTYSIRKEFSQDGRNLLLKEENENGKAICYSYLPNTNLMTTKLIKDHDFILLREFNDYDDSYNLIQTISDNGNGKNKNDLSGVTQRTIINYILRQQAPFLHMPEWIEEKYLEHGNEKLLKRKRFVYDSHGNIAQEEVHDAHGHLTYTIYKEYNERGDLLSETNPLEQKAVYGYTHRGEQNFRTNFSGRVQTSMRYDTNGRLREKREVGDNNISHETLSKYDFHDRLIQETDIFQNSTHYSYDPLVNEITQTDFPPVASTNKQPATVTTISSYDPFGREITQTDANGNTIVQRYNAYGSTIETEFPHGGKEFFLYRKDGILASHTDQEGLTVSYTHDVLGRVLSKTYLTSRGEAVAQERFTYSGFNLLTETDKAGNLKKYSYDGSGRKIKEEASGHVTDYRYDSLGRLSTIFKHNGDNSLIIHYKKDLEGRILEESKTDVSGHPLYKISYTYDKDGNTSKITRSINGMNSVATFTYDSFGRLIEQREANSSVTRRSYNEKFTNQLGQRVLQTAIRDPLNIVTLETRDALNRIVKKELQTPQGITLSSEEWIYDPHGNLIYQKDHVYENSQFVNTQTIQYTYTPVHQLESYTRAYGRKDANTTTCTYLHSGKIKTKKLPNGITLSYKYHPLGFLHQLSSSDGTILHRFEYDNLGHLKYARDERQNIAIERQVDPFGNITREVFPFAPVVNKKYDHLNQLISLKMEGVGEVSYKYDPLFLREVVRSSNDGKALYTHRYDNYDMDGNLFSEKLMGNVGQVVHRTDLRGQKTSISSPYFSQYCSYDSVGNLIDNMINQAGYRYSYDSLSQLFSEKGPNQSSIYAYDSLYNRTKKNGTTSNINELNQLVSFGEKRCSYDLNGNQTIKQTPSEEFRLLYDPLNRLVEAISQKTKIVFVYDPLGRRLNKIVYALSSSGWKETENEHYLYHGQYEIGALSSNHELKNLRVLGIDRKNNPLTIGIELGGEVFAPILDVQGNVRVRVHRGRDGWS